MSKAPTIEILLDGAAAAWLATCGGAAIMIGAPAVGLSAPLPIALACAAAVALVTYRGFAAFGRQVHRLPAFAALPIETSAPGENQLDELLLTSTMAFEARKLLMNRGVAISEDALLLTPEMAVLTSELLLTRGQMLVPPVQEPAEPLLLDDVLAQLRPDARVVQLFDPARVPTAGELKSRIDRHLNEAGRGPVKAGGSDASQALYDALADLRRSLA